MKYTYLVAFFIPGTRAEPIGVAFGSETFESSKAIETSQDIAHLRRSLCERHSKPIAIVNLILLSAKPNIINPLS